MLRKFALFFVLSSTAFASTSAATATITDSDSQTWNNGTWTATLSSPNGPPTISGVPVATTFASGTLSGSGALSVTLTDTSSIDQSGAQWCFVITPNASVPSSPQICTTVVGATPSLSTALSNGVTAPRFAPGTYSYGYADKEVTGAPQAGAQYYQVACTCVRSYSATNGWTGTSNSGGYNPASVAITGGAINGTSIGGTTPAAGAFTTLSSTGTTGLGSAGTVTQVVVSNGGTGRLRITDGVNINDIYGNKMQASASFLFVTFPSGYFDWQPGNSEQMRLSNAGGLTVGTGTFNNTDPGANNVAIQGTASAGTVSVNGGGSTVYICSGGTFAGLLATSSGACTGGSGTATHLLIQ